MNTETLYTQFVHLGNLPDGGYSELEILCVGLRFGRVDHYMVITNKNKVTFAFYKGGVQHLWEEGGQSEEGGSA